MLLQVHGWLPDLVEATVENLETLWIQWIHGRRAFDWRLRALRALEARIEAHVDATLLAGQEALPFIEATLGGGFLPADLAAANVCLRGDQALAIELLMSSFAKAAPEDRAGMLQALRLGPVKLAASALEALLKGEDEGLAAAAALALLAHQHPSAQASLRPDRIASWRGDGEASLRSLGWLICAHAKALPSPAEVDSGLSDEAAAVREAACTACLALGLGLRPALLSRASADPVALRCLGIIGAADDLAFWRGVLENEALGEARYDALASYGQPALIPELIARMEDEEAIFAGRAFLRMTGLDITSEDEDEEGERLPDPTIARAFWKERGPGAQQRWASGVEVDELEGPLEQLDLRAIWEHQLRQLYQKRASFGLAELERYPHWIPESPG